MFNDLAIGKERLQKVSSDRFRQTHRHEDPHVGVKDGGVVVDQQGVEEGQRVDLHVAAGVLVPGHKQFNSYKCKFTHPQAFPVHTARAEEDNKRKVIYSQSSCEHAGGGGWMQPGSCNTQDYYNTYVQI